MKKKWYLNTWFICILMLFWPLILPLIIGIILLILNIIDEKRYKEQVKFFQQEAIRTESELQQEIKTLKTQNSDFQKSYNEVLSEIKDYKTRLEECGAFELFQIKDRIEILNNEVEQRHQTIATLTENISMLSEKHNKELLQIQSTEKRLKRVREIYRSVDHAINNFFDIPLEYQNCKLPLEYISDFDEIAPSITLKLHCMDIQSLRKTYNENQKYINTILKKYSARYTTKANRSIYALMVIALRAELQNILYNLKYEKLDNALERLKTMSAKYLKIAAEGNQSIAVTLTKFIGEIEYLFSNAIKIEYNYYVKKEQARQEQLAIREQMRQEAEERKSLAEEKKRIEKEEAKYQVEIEKLKENLGVASDEETQRLNARILELQNQLATVIIKKEEISTLQNGKAGNVYVISNLGSFGENVFKIGMTRRLDPQDRINELGSASVPFKFDVHSFIFSDDAVSLENKLHEMLSDKRLNKVNLRKEFFKVTIDELENLVTTIEPTAEFNKTMLAEEFRQSMSSDEVYSSSYTVEEIDDDE